VFDLLCTYFSHNQYVVVFMFGIMRSIRYMKNQRIQGHDHKNVLE
jgi:hypothetical protein